MVHHYCTGMVAFYVVIPMIPSLTLSHQSRELNDFCSEAYTSLHDVAFINLKLKGENNHFYFLIVVRY